MRKAAKHSRPTVDGYPDIDHVPHHVEEFVQFCGGHLRGDFADIQCPGWRHEWLAFEFMLHGVVPCVLHDDRPPFEYLAVHLVDCKSSGVDRFECNISEPKEHISVNKLMSFVFSFLIMKSPRKTTHPLLSPLESRIIETFSTAPNFSI